MRKWVKGSRFPSQSPLHASVRLVDGIILHHPLPSVFNTTAAKHSQRTHSGIGPSMN